MAVSIEYKEVEKKLLILYLINRMEISMSRAQITDFVLTKDFMDYFTLEQTLAAMEEQELLEVTQVNAQDANTTRYTVTNAGLTSLEYFENHIPRTVRILINQYINENRRQIEKDYESTANIFPNVENNDFLVKCGVYDDKRPLLELTVSVDTREQAKLIQTNWRNDSSGLYKRIIDALT